MKEENVTIEELLTTVKAGFARIEGEMATKEDLRDIRNDIDQLKEGAFSKDEKENILTVIKHLDQQLEDETLGRKSITLTRGEYDDVANTVGFENRFEKIGK